MSGLIHTALVLPVLARDLGFYAAGTACHPKLIGVLPVLAVVWANTANTCNILAVRILPVYFQSITSLLPVYYRCPGCVLTVY